MMFKIRGFTLQLVLYPTWTQHEACAALPLQFKLNTDESPGVATEYGIRSIPTVMVFKDGTKMDTVIGAVPKDTLVQTIEKYLDN